VSVPSRAYFVFAVLITAFWAFAVERLGLNRISTILALRTGINTAARACALCALLVLSIFFFYRSVTFARAFVVLGLALLFVFSIFLVHIFRRILYAVDMSRNGRLSVAIVGTDEHGLRVANHLAGNEAARCRIACFVSLPGQPQSIDDAPVLPWEQLGNVVDVFHCSEILICLAPDQIGRSHDIVKAVQHLCVPARMVMDLGDGIFVPDRVFEYYGIPLLDIRPCPVDTIAYSLGKRAFDVCFSVGVLLLASPLLVVLSLLIKLTSSGPIFFKQERVGLSGQPFYMYKFRTMRIANSSVSDTHWTTQHDPRVTSFGAFLRRTSLDELPQFFNVLRGEMSVVGPRPERPHFVHKFLKEVSSYSVRHSLKVGITGWAQVNGWRGDTSIKKRIEYDLYYLENWSFSFDLRIIVLTLFSGLIARNAY
jgi:Undecaprenyl-phosphate glucose phosphotransferase